ncbi:MAG: methenyltetrahydromethanopterin cyclohydrolase [Burkholderiaceae bacterium]|jgi:methenyltetrahydromethanopterin cyclohydrolase
MSTPRVDLGAGRWPSVNQLVAPLVGKLLEDAAALRLGVERLASGATIIDAGALSPGGVEAGRRIAEICLGGLGRVSLTSVPAGGPWEVGIHTSHPILACLGSQYAGWSLAHGSGKTGFHALASGPGRAIACKEELFAELGYRDHAEAICFVLEVDRNPPSEVVEKVCRDCQIAPEKLTFILTPTRSLAGCVQIAARSLEVALHKLHALHFPLHDVVDGLGSAPLPPPGADFLTAMGRTNDAILFGGRVHLFVNGPDDAAQSLAEQLPSSASRDYGRPFAEVFRDNEFDFYRIDPLLFAPAQVSITALASGRSFHSGRVDHALLEKSFA